LVEPEATVTKRTNSRAKPAGSTRSTGAALRRIATGLLAARNALGLGRFDPWLVNIDAEYHEAGESR